MAMRPSMRKARRWTSRTGISPVAHQLAIEFSSSLISPTPYKSTTAWLIATPLSYNTSSAVLDHRARCMNYFALALLALHHDLRAFLQALYIKCSSRFTRPLQEFCMLVKTDGNGHD